MKVIYMLGTDTCVHILKHHPSNLQRIFEAYGNKAQKICISAVTYAELLAGAARSGSQQLREKVDDFASLFEIVDWTAICARYYRNIMLAMAHPGSPIGNMDMMVAAAALASNATLVTTKEDSFSSVKSLKTANWFSE